MILGMGYGFQGQGHGAPAVLLNAQRQDKWVAQDRATWQSTKTFAM